MAVNTQALFGVVQREGMEKGFWTRIGTAFQNQDGSWNLRFDYLPTDRAVTIQMRPTRTGEDLSDRAAAAEASTAS
ncbi:MAG: hypothetical protein M5U32_08805 [Myxococcota bacterium]|nr:hypothetical protein [Myxococcota bacterium]